MITNKNNSGSERGDKYWIRAWRRIPIRERGAMAKPIILGVRLRGRAAREFERYMASPDCTERGKELILESARRAEKYPQLY